MAALQFLAIGGGGGRTQVSPTSDALHKEHLHSVGHLYPSPSALIAPPRPRAATGSRSVSVPGVGQRMTRARPYRTFFFFLGDSHLKPQGASIMD